MDYRSQKNVKIIANYNTTMWLDYAPVIDLREILKVKLTIAERTKHLYNLCNSKSTSNAEIPINSLSSIKVLYWTAKPPLRTMSPIVL